MKPSTDLFASSGIVGLDEILRGGFKSHQLYLIEGGTGVGKTTLALQFLMRGAQLGQRALYIGFSETPEDIEQIAQSHSWSLQGIQLRKIASDVDGSERMQYTLFPASEVELHTLMQEIIEVIETAEPQRLVIDPISALRWFAADYSEYRRYIESLARALGPHECTSLLLDDVNSTEPQFHPRGLVDGVIALSTREEDYGPDHRRLRLEKLRGVPVASGWHDYQIATGGLDVFPRIESESLPAFKRSGPPLLAETPGFGPLLGGGIPWGNSVLITGPAGTGKSSIAMRLAVAAAARGDTVLYLSFDEALDNIVARSRALSLDVTAHVDAGRLRLRKIDPATISPGQVSHSIRSVVETVGDTLAMVVIDSISGYLHATASSRYLDLQLHQLLDYLSRRGVIGLMVLTQQGVIGDVHAPVDLSYLSDIIVLTRFFEAEGSLHRAVSIVKHRTHGHEQTIRELVMSERGIQLSEPLTRFKGLLTGTPYY